MTAPPDVGADCSKRSYDSVIGRIAALRLSSPSGPVGIDTPTLSSDSFPDGRIRRIAIAARL